MAINYPKLLEAGGTSLTFEWSLQDLPEDWQKVAVSDNQKLRTTVKVITGAKKRTIKCQFISNLKFSVHELIPACVYRFRFRLCNTVTKEELFTEECNFPSCPPKPILISGETLESGESIAILEWDPIQHYDDCSYLDNTRSDAWYAIEIAKNNLVDGEFERISVTKNCYIEYNAGECAAFDTFQFRICVALGFKESFIKPKSDEFIRNNSIDKVSDNCCFIVAPAVPTIIQGNDSEIHFEWDEEVISKYQELSAFNLNPDIQLEYAANILEPNQLPNLQPQQVLEPNVPDEYHQENAVSFSSMSNRRHCIKGLKPSSWYWFRTSCLLNSQFSSATSAEIAVSTSAGKPEVPEGFSEQHSVFYDENNRIIHIYLKLYWKDIHGNGAPIRSYRVQRLNNCSSKPDRENTMSKRLPNSITDEKWINAYSGQAPSCVLSVILPARKVFKEKCVEWIFRVFGVNAVGCGGPANLTVSINALELNPNHEQASTQKTLNEWMVLNRRKTKANLLQQDYFGGHEKQDMNSLLVTSSSIHKPSTSQEKTHKRNRHHKNTKKQRVSYKKPFCSKKKPWRLGISRDKSHKRSEQKREYEKLLGSMRQQIAVDNFIITDQESKKTFPKRNIAPPTYISFTNKSPSPRSGHNITSKSKNLNQYGLDASCPGVQDNAKAEYDCLNSSSKKSNYISVHAEKDSWCLESMEKLGIANRGLESGIDSSEELERILKLEGEFWTYQQKRGFSFESKCNNNMSGQYEDSMLARIRYMRRPNYCRDNRSKLLKKSPNQNINNKQSFTENQNGTNMMTQKVKSGNGYSPLEQGGHQENRENKLLRNDTIEFRSSHAFLQLNNKVRVKDQCNSDYFTLRMQEKLEMAAFTIQRHLKGHFARKEYQHKLKEIKSTEVIQNAYRHRIWSKRRKNAVIIIQTNCRQRQAVLRTANYRVKANTAATKLQSLFRRTNAIKETDILRKEKKQREVKVKMDAAVSIQKNVRARNIRKSFKKQRHASIQIQALYRGRIEKRKYNKYQAEKTFRAAAMMQRYFRGFKARQRIEKTRRKVMNKIKEVKITAAGNRKANGVYQMAGISCEAARFIYTDLTDGGTSYILERVEMNNSRVWTISSISSLNVVTTLYANTEEGYSMKPPKSNGWVLVEGKPPTPNINWLSKSDSVLALDESHVLVIDAGCSHLNGNMKAHGRSDGVEQFILETASEVCMLKRVTYGEGSKIWVLVGQVSSDTESADDRDKAESQKIYYVNNEHGEKAYPPAQGWLE